ncbi:MAG: S41 family peptidase [Gemmatimonadota bacterium]|nr:S41 family peptidase [Gemmatimonadota bacterium]MDH3422906.1 S41 family peptidase [Gemmatimonadota bacterium]
MLRRSIAWPLALPLLAACTDAGPAEPDGALGLDAAAYLEDAVNILQLWSVNRYEIDWPSFRAETIADAGGAMTIEETYPAIEAAIERLGDGHSFFRRPIEGPPAPEGDQPSASRLGEIGYVDVTRFSGGGADADALASEYHRLIEGVDTLGATCRWVVDVRGNTGGNMWPMVAGVGPILGEDTVGFFIDPDSLTKSWVYAAGEASIDDVVITAASPSYELETPRPYVAVLTDGQTASSGEAVAVAFRGRAGARSFGEPTWGVSTANSAFPLIDGAVIFLTVSTMVDRTGTIYGAELTPDEIVSRGAKTGDPTTDRVLDAAVQWLAAQTCS